MESTKSFGKKYITEDRFIDIFFDRKSKHRIIGISRNKYLTLEIITNKKWLARAIQMWMACSKRKQNLKQCGYREILTITKYFKVLEYIPFIIFIIRNYEILQLKSMLKSIKISG